MLERGYAPIARPPRLWFRRVVLGSLAIASIVVLGVVFWPARELDCKTSSRTASDGLTVTVCQGEYERTKLPITGAYLADALRRSGNLEAAAAIANDLLSTDVRADGLQILGKIAATQSRTDDAVKYLDEARQLHRQRSNHVELARDLQALALIHEGREQYVEALRTLEECISEAQTARDVLTEAYCHLTAARTLMSVGFFAAASEELDRAEAQSASDRERAQLWFWRGNLAQESMRDPQLGARDRQAVQAFERSLEFAQRGKVTSLLVLIHLNLAYSLAETGNTDDADRHLAEAGVLDRDRTFENHRRQIAARIAYRRGDLTLASSLNDQAYPKIDDGDDRIDVCVMQARIALAGGDLPAAAQWARRGVEQAEQVRAEQTGSELRPWVLASRREPFELLFTAYARAARLEEAVTVFDQWQGRTLLDNMARPSSDPSPGLSSTAAEIQSLGRWLPAVSKASLMINEGRAAVQALRTIDLVALVIAEHEVWRLTASLGRSRLDKLGPLDKLRDRLESFSSTPTDSALSSELGALILPDDIVRETREPLYVVLDAQFGAVPFAALQRYGRPLIASRPMVIAPRLPVIASCEPPAGNTGAVVLADASDDLPEARREASTVASMLGTTPLVGTAATSTALFAARSSSLLHVAVHANYNAGGGRLRLHDREVLAPEISASRLGPPLVVLAGCSTARSGDPEAARSLSTAFLAAGAGRVVATLRQVPDDDARTLTTRFYQAGGAEDPIGVLARVQAELARIGYKEWPNFAVFGSQICKRR